MLIKFFMLLLLSGISYSATMNFRGNVRTETSMLNGLGLQGSGGDSKAYILNRFLLYPTLIIDDHFSIFSEWNLLHSRKLTPTTNSPLNVGQGGYIMGDSEATLFEVRRAWLEWTSDFGVFSIGRMPVSWGYGLIWDSGQKPWDDFGTTFDRLEYRLHFGNMVGAIAYNKGRKLNLIGSNDDQQFYTFYLRYINRTNNIEGGFIYENQVRSPSQEKDLEETNNQYQLPDGYTNAYPLHTKTPTPFNSHVIDVYLKKSVGYFTFGGEFGWLSGSAFDYDGIGTGDSLNAFGSVFNVTFEYHKIKALFDLIFASPDNNLNDNNLSGFIILNRNRRMGLILGKELLGNYHGNGANLGSLVVYGNDGTFSGLLGLKPGFRVEWSSDWSSWIDLIWASKLNNESKNLGVEIDIGADYSVYRNLDLHLTVGYLIPGNGLRVNNPQGAFGIQFCGNLRF